MSMQQTITDKLTAAFAPSFLNVIDESENHRGHGGWREGGETHFRVQITAEKLQDMSRVNQHRAINEVLAGELASTIHALAIEVRA